MTMEALETDAVASGAVASGAVATGWTVPEAEVICLACEISAYAPADDPLL
jgi:hypothetical protein